MSLWISQLFLVISQPFFWGAGEWKVNTTLMKFDGIYRRSVYTIVMCVAAVWNKSPGLEADSRTVEVTHVNARSGQGTSHQEVRHSFSRKKDVPIAYISPLRRVQSIHWSEHHVVQLIRGVQITEKIWEGIPDASLPNASGAHLIASPASLPSLLVLLRQSSEGWTADPWPDPSIPMMVILSQWQFESEFFTLVTLRSLRPFDITSENKHSSS